MSLIDTTIGLLAPHQCIVCRAEGEVLCADCLLSAGDPIPPRCAGCKKYSKDYKTCTSCKSWLPIYAVYVATNYEGVYEQLEKAFKFDVKRPAAKPMAEMMSDAMPRLQDIDYICPLPTSHAHIRARGFDHASYLAKAFASRTNVPVKKVLKRISNTRQVGSSRARRMQQMSSAYEVTNSADVEGKVILLLDDVTTTGASLAAAAKLLKNSVVKRIYAIVYAQKL